MGSLTPAYVYLDTSFIVALLMPEAQSARAIAFLRSTAPFVMSNDFVAAEFASSVARMVRMGELTRRQARAVFAEFDVWRRDQTISADLVQEDLVAAGNLIRRLDLPMRAPDALHIAICQRVSATLATFDDKMAVSAGRLGLTVAAI